MPTCLNCRRVTKGGSRCVACKANPHLNPRAFRDSPAERARCKIALDCHIAAHGLLCAGWPEGHHEPHLVRRREDLTIDHEPALSQVDDPALWNGDRIARCRSINSSKGNRS